MSGGGGLDVSRPSAARIYNYLLGGKDHFEVDRVAADKIVAAAPDVVAVAQQNRAFLGRAVRWCAQAGIDQFVDIGCGLPVSPNVHELVQEIDEGAVVVGVDNDPLVLTHSRALLNGTPVLEGDLRDPPRLVEALGRSMDWARPVAVLLVAVLHFIPDDQEPAAVVARIRERMAPGSLLVISHACSTGADPAVVDEIESIYQGATSPAVFRSADQIGALFAGLDLVPPGLVPVERWHPERAPQRVRELPTRQNDGGPDCGGFGVPVLGGIGRLRSGGADDRT